MKEYISFDEFINNFGFRKYPFSQFSTEDELQIRDKLFYSPSDYSRLLDVFTNGQTMLILGNRGTGKTAMLHDIHDKSNKDDMVVAWIDDFSKLPLRFNDSHFYSLVIEKLTEELFLKLIYQRERIGLLSNEKKILLVYLLNEFLPKVSRAELVRRIENVRHSWLISRGKKLLNFSRDVLNYGITAAIQFSSDIIRQHFTTLPPAPKSIILKEYFPEIPYEADKPMERQKITYDFLKRCLELVVDLGYQRFVLYLDKIDEDGRLKNDAESIANFIEPVLINNNFLFNPKMQVIISLWNIPFSYMSDKVRSQKLYLARLTWEQIDLEGALNKRLGVFADKDVVYFKDLFNEEVNKDILDQLFYLSNANPRDLWHVLDHIFIAQYKADPYSRKLTYISIEKGLHNFVENFNYYEYYPRKANARKDSLDVYSYIKHLLRVAKKDFTRNAFKEASGVSGGSVNNYVNHMQRMGLVAEDDRDGTQLVYKVIDPKIQYAIEHGLNIRKVS